VGQGPDDGQKSVQRLLEHCRKAEPLELPGAGGHDTLGEQDVVQ
jgi:hypothetical protein